MSHFPAPGRPPDPARDHAIQHAALGLLVERGFERMSLDVVADRARVSKPTIYRRYPTKSALAAAVVCSRASIPEIAPTLEVREALWRFLEQAVTEEDVALAAALLAERDRHPELLIAFRKQVLLPRRHAAVALVRAGQARGEVRDDVAAGTVVDLLVGPLVTQLLLGLPTPAAWRTHAFNTWWALMRPPADGSLPTPHSRTRST